MPKKFSELKIGDKFYFRVWIVMKRDENQVEIIEGLNRGHYLPMSPTHVVETMVDLEPLLRKHLAQTHV